jgi:hypothetical protein
MLGISSRGFGSCLKENGLLVVQDDIQISCWDYVWMPSTNGAFMESLNESAYVAKVADVGFTRNQAQQIEKYENQINNATIYSENRSSQEFVDLLSALKRG